MRISDWSSDVCSSDLSSGAGSGAGAGCADESSVVSVVGAVFESSASSFDSSVGVPVVESGAGAGSACSAGGVPSVCWSWARAGVAAIPAAAIMAIASLRIVFRPYLRSEEHTSELQSLMRISYAVFGLKKKHKDSSIYQSKLHK